MINYSISLRANPSDKGRRCRFFARRLGRGTGMTVTARGFRTAGYHFYIRRDGSVTQFRRLLEVGAHCHPWNRCSIGICYEGGLDAEGHPADTRTPEQCEQLLLLLMKLKKLFPEARICGHRDMPGSIPKACPCFDAESEYGFLER